MILFLNILVSVVVLVNIFIVIANINILKTFKLLQEKNFEEPIETLSYKEAKEEKKKQELTAKFLQEAKNVLFDKKLFPIIDVDEDGYYEIFHQNPGTTDLYKIIKNFDFPPTGPKTNDWKRCIALIKEAGDDFIEKHREEIKEHKIILEEMPRDDFYK